MERKIRKPRTKKQQDCYFDCVLIDDDPLVRTAWKISAARNGKKLALFTCCNDFFKDSEKLSRKAVVYIDSNLGNGEKGEKEAKYIYQLGFNKILLTTSYSASQFGKIPWIAKIINKTPPWDF